ncbi:CG32537 [Drosophila busckii]|uniref:CG32537 n=1 Tax=Drosophila busckii TaxID=30019 RepID=A0A0M4F974_DROBS|nr:RNA polymerase II degradation factor 1 [Drosophila busckii]ALC48707.1 CG32537 [Drosophila busckii]
MLLLLLLLLLGAASGYDQSVNYWEALAPGKLLQRLDALTLTEMQPAEALAKPLSAPLATAQAKLDYEADVDVDDAEAEAEYEPDEAETDVNDEDISAQSAETEAEPQSGEDYERNYEQFVREYFDRTPQQDDDDGYDGSLETQAEASNVQQKQQQQKTPKQKQRCRSVRRHGQLCQICREPRNNEVSESCSYSMETQPEKYAYGMGSKYKRYRQQPELEHEPEQSDEQQHGERPQREAGSQCVRRVQAGSVCYDCQDNGGQQLRRCYDAAAEQRKSHKPRESQQTEHEREQRIYKRTISYSYASGSSPSSTTTTTTTTLAPSSTAAPRRKWAKKLRRPLATTTTSILPKN